MKYIRIFFSYQSSRARATSVPAASVRTHLRKSSATVSTLRSSNSKLKRFFFPDNIRVRIAMAGFFFRSYFSLYDGRRETNELKTFYAVGRQRWKETERIRKRSAVSGETVAETLCAVENRVGLYVFRCLPRE